MQNFISVRLVNTVHFHADAARKGVLRGEPADIAPPILRSNGCSLHASLCK